MKSLVVLDHKAFSIVEASENNCYIADNIPAITYLCDNRVSRIVILLDRCKSGISEAI